jgi:hypothetical protein
LDSNKQLSYIFTDTNLVFVKDNIYKRKYTEKIFQLNSVKNVAFTKINLVPTIIIVGVLVALTALLIIASIELSNLNFNFNHTY